MDKFRAQMSTASETANLQRLADLGLLIEDARAIIGQDHPAADLLMTLGAALLDAANASDPADGPLQQQE